MENKNEQQKWQERSTTYLFHSSQTHCIFLQLVSQTIQASSATASRNFNVHLATIEDVGLQHVAEQDYILPKGSVSFVYDGFISADAILQHARQLIEPEATAVNYIAFSKAMQSFSRKRYSLMTGCLALLKPGYNQLAMSLKQKVLSTLPQYAKKI